MGVSLLRLIMKSFRLLTRLPKAPLSHPSYRLFSTNRNLKPTAFAKRNGSLSNHFASLEHRQTSHGTFFSNVSTSLQFLRHLKTEAEVPQEKTKNIPLTDTAKIREREEAERPSASASRFAGKMLAYASKRNITMERNAYVLYHSIQDQVERDDLFELFGFPHTYASWFTFTLLHIWMVLVRLRLEGPVGHKYGQLLFNHFWNDVESRLVGMGISNPIILSREMKIQARMYYAQVVGYDEGLHEGDAQLADALWRNIYGLEKVSAARLNCLVHYIKREMELLDETENRILFGGLMKWGMELPPMNE